MFAVISIQNFALQALLRNEPELRGRAVALVESIKGNIAKSFILECNRAAEAAGVYPGITAPQAQARCKELVLKSRSPAAERSATEILLQTAYVFSPNIEDTAPGVCTIDLRGLNFGNSEATNKWERTTNGDVLFVSTAAHDHTAQQSFNFLGNNLECGDESLHSKSLLELWGGTIVSALRQLGLEAQLGIAVTPNLALLAARAAMPVLVIERTEEFFHSLPIAALEPTPPVLDVLKRWGIHTAGAFLALGRDAIAERLGAEALQLFHRASEHTVRPLNILVPPDTFEEQMDFEAHIETIEPLLFVLRRFVEQLATRIALTYRVVAELRLTLALESGAPYERTLKVPAPTANVETLFRMLHTHLENVRTDAPIQSLRLAALPVRAEGQQFGLFESALRDPNHFHETLARLAALLGAERVGTPVAEPTHRPDAFRMKTPEFGDSQSPIDNRETRSPKPEARSKSEIRSATALCLRRFRSPLHAEVEMKDGQPTFISTLAMSARIRRVRGPWCTSGTWWDPRRWSRQEWDVETDKGEVWRVRNADGDWLVEGIYD